MRPWLVVLLLPLAGCLDGPDGTLDAHAAYAQASRGLDDFEYVLFLGIAATEGALDADAYRASLDGTWADLHDAFGPLPQDGVAGDGLAAAWITTHYVWDRESDRAGGLFTLVTPQGVERAFLPFIGVYGGAPGTLANARGAGLPTGLAAPDEDAAPVLCPLETGTRSWHLGAVDAVRQARMQESFQEHEAGHPGGEYTYAYMPSLSVDPSCGEADLDGNRWTVLHTDLEGLMNGTDRLAAQVRVDAGNGTVLEAGITALLGPTTTMLEGRIAARDPLLPVARQTHAFSFEVEPDTAFFDLHAIRRAVPDGVRDAETRLVDPTDQVRSSVSFGTPVHQHFMESPTPGTWRLEYVYDAAVPQGEHAVDVFVKLVR